MTLELARLTGIGTYTFNFNKGRWERRWSLDSLAILHSNFPMCRSYTTGHVKPSVEVSR